MISRKNYNLLWQMQKDVADVLFAAVPYLGPQTLMILQADYIFRVVDDHLFAITWETV